MIIIPWRCEICGAKLKGTEKKCPSCGNKAVYRCRAKGCGKELKDGKYALCPLCRSKRKEKINNGLKKTGEIGVGCLAIVGGALKAYKDIKGSRK